MFVQWRSGAMFYLMGATLGYPGGLELDSLIRLGRENNADVQVSRRETESVAQDTLAVRTRSNPALEVEALRNLDEGTAPKAGARLSQEFHPGVRARQFKVSRARYSAVQEIQKARELDLVLNIRSTFFAWQILDRKGKLQQEVRGRWESLSHLATAKVAEGTLSQVDQLQTQLNSAKARQREMEIRTEMESLERKLALLTGQEKLSDSLAHSLPDSLPEIPRLDWVLSWVDMNSPDLEALNKEVSVQKEQFSLEQSLRNPSFNLSLGYEREIDGTQLVGGGLVFPLPLFNRNQFGITKAKSTLQIAELRKAAAAQNLRSDLSEIHGRLVKLGERYRDYQRQIKDLSGKQLSLSEKGFRQGLLGVFDLSRVQEEALNQDLEALNVLGGFYDLWNRLGRILGGKTW